VDRAEILALLRELGRRLDAESLTGEMYVVGGAAMALAYDERRATRDIDAVFEPKARIYAIASVMAEDLALPPGWLNDAVKGFLGGPDPHAAPVLDAPGIRVLAASPAMLLGLKVLAHRAGEDDDDIQVLARALGLTTADAVLARAEQIVGPRLTVAAELFVRELFP
jgi:hypothetical protein